MAPAKSQTLIGKTEAATVLLEPPADTSGRVSAADAQTAIKPGETTVVRSASLARQTVPWRVAPWAIGAAAFVLAGVLCVAFYAYQHRNGSTGPDDSAAGANVNSVTGQPSPTDPAANQPSSGSLGNEKKVVVASHPEETPEPARKVEKAAGKNEKGGDRQANKNGGPPPAPDVSEEDSDVKVPKRRKYLFPTRRGRAKAAAGKWEFPPRVICVTGHKS